jgi:peptidoglycan/xylan/chitin deacetylase (PgdA/CDA1 family)
MHRIPACLPFCIPGIGDEMEGAMQQAAQPVRHFISLLITYNSPFFAIGHFSCDVNDDIFVHTYAQTTIALKITFNAIKIKDIDMIRVLCGFFFLFLAASFVAADEPSASLLSLKQQISSRFSGRTPHQWGENVPGVHTRLDTDEKVIALTLDACGSAKGAGVDARLMDFLDQERIPATLFVNARWIDANPALFRKLAANPLFEIANHGLRHKPASVNGRSVYGINGTKDVWELVDEIELNARKIESITGIRPKFYRSGTAYYDDVAVEMSRFLKHEVAGYTVLGDAGATFSAGRVKAALLKAMPGDIMLCHMNHPESGTGSGIMAALPELRRRGFLFVHLSDYPLK